MPRLAPYAKQHKDPQGPGDARPTASQIIKDQGLVWSPLWAGKTVLITGCSPGGLGPETAKAIRSTGAQIFITARDVAKGQEVVESISSDGNSAKIEVIQMDLASLESVCAGAEEFLHKSSNRLNVLINNAGVMFCPQGETPEGFELHFATNHLGYFYLFQLLNNALISSSSPSFNSCIISVSSSTHRSGVIQLDNLNLKNKEYNPQVAYRQSKLANIHFANKLDRRYQSQGLRAMSIHPGGIITPLARYLPGTDNLLEDPDISRTLKNPAQGAATTVWAAVAKELEGRGGLYLDEVAEAELALPDTLYYLGGYALQAFDLLTEKKLWEKSLQLIGGNEY